MGVERRVSPRLRLRRKIALRLPGNEVVSAWSYDISSGGMQFLSERHLALGLLVDLQLPLPDESQPEGFHRIQLRGRVAYVVLEPGSGDFRTGIEFLEFRDDGRARFDRYWDAMLRQQLTRQGTR